MQEQTKIEETVESIKDYVNTRHELAILKASDKVAIITSTILSFIPIIFLTVVTFLILSIGLALYLNIIFVSNYFGFLVVGGGYFVVLFFLVCVRKKLIVKPFRNKIIKELFKTNNL